MKVDFIGNTVDDRTGTIELRATFQNPDLRLVPGELVDISVNLEMLRQVVTVPHDALNVGQNINYVFVVDKDNKVQMRKVDVLYQDQVMAALGSGVKAGDRVVTDGQLRLTPGVTVDILPGPGEAAEANAQALAPQDSARPQGAAVRRDRTPVASLPRHVGCRGRFAESNNKAMGSSFFARQMRPKTRRITLSWHPFRSARTRRITWLGKHGH